MRLRHEELTNQELITMYGKMWLDEDGFVTDVENEPADLKTVIKNVPGIVDGDLFLPPPREKNPQELAAEEAQKKLTEAANFKRFEAEDYKGLIKEMLEEGQPVNSEGYLDMGAFNTRLRSMGQKVIPGTLRRKFQDEVLPKPSQEQPADQSGAGDGAET
jgi:hypothetical protein